MGEGSLSNFPLPCRNLIIAKLKFNFREHDSILLIKQVLGAGQCIFSSLMVA
jgi:hypothetical protein